MLIKEEVIPVYFYAKMKYCSKNKLTHHFQDYVLGIYLSTSGGINLLKKTFADIFNINKKNKHED